MKKIGRDQLKQKIDAGEEFVLIETLSAASYQSWHLPGAINIPKTEIGDRAENLIPDKSAMVVTYCASPACTASTIAADKLEEMGYTNVYEYEGGKSDWEEAGYPKEID